MSCADFEQLLSQMVEQKLLTDYQAARIASGKTFGLLLGNYRVLDRLGAGGMGILFKAEHVYMRRLAAIKVLPCSLMQEQSDGDLHRFHSEVRAVAQLQHPNIVNAVDAGQVTSGDPDATVIHYYAMEYVEGRDLEALIEDEGSLAPVRACTLIFQVAGALNEAHKHNLVHRDIKPANVMVTPEGQAKLLDFGLVRHFRHRMTEPGTALGTVDYMAPEQARDASAVDIRADIYGLGGVLFWCLTGRPPFSGEGNMAQLLTQRQTQTPPSIRTLRPDVPAELDAVVTRMMACRPDDRYPTPQAVMNGLLPFLEAQSLNHPPPTCTAQPSLLDAIHLDGGTASPRVNRVLIADDEAPIRMMCRHALAAEGIHCEEARDGLEALTALGAGPFDLLITDWKMPGLTGPELCQKVRENPPTPHFKIMLISGHVTDSDLAQILGSGADDCLTKPFSLNQMVRTRALLRLKDCADPVPTCSTGNFSRSINTSNKT